LPRREQALKQAVQEARSKAQVMADALRVNLNEVLEVAEGGVSIMQPQMAMTSRVMTMAADVNTPVSPGEIEVNASVTVRYRISPKP
jgi:uncharacterized protein YggE